jgi:hypothetical protein
MPMPMLRPRGNATSNERKASPADPAHRSDNNSNNSNTEAEEEDPVVALNRRALELLRDGSYGPAAARLKRALHLTKADVVARNRNRADKHSGSGSDGDSSTTRSPQDGDDDDDGDEDDDIPRAQRLTLLPYDVGQGWATSMSGSCREPLAFQPVLRGMLLVEQESSSSSSSSSSPTEAGDSSLRTSSSTPCPLPTVSAGAPSSSSPLRSDDRHGRVVMALCYNLGMVYHLLALRLSTELQEEGEEQGDETATARHQVDACLRKALRFYDLVSSTTVAVSSSEEEEEEPHEPHLHHRHDSDDIILDESDRLLRVAVLANAGHAHYCLREMDHVRQCADELCLALLPYDENDDDKAEHVSTNADRDSDVAAWPTTGPSTPGASSPGGSSMTSVLRLPLALNVLLYSEVRHPAPSA